MSRVQIARRKMYLHQQLSNYNRVAMRLSERLHELHKFSASIARGFMSPFDLAGMPISCLARAESYFATQYGPLVGANVFDRVYKTCMASNNPNLTVLADPNNPQNVENVLKAVQERMPFDETFVQNGLGYGGFDANIGTPPAKYYGPLSGNRQEYTAGGMDYSDPNLKREQQCAALEHMVRNAYKEELREMHKAEAEKIKVVEDEITQEQQLNNTRIQVTQTELKEVEQHEKDAIDRAKATYA